MKSGIRNKLLGGLLAAALMMPAAGVAQTTRLSDSEIGDAWVYLFTRLLVLRQQQLDFQEGFKWNEVVHRKPQSRRRLLGGVGRG
jgi:hypothetical protein